MFLVGSPCTTSFLARGLLESQSPMLLCGNQGALRQASSPERGARKSVVASAVREFEAVAIRSRRRRRGRRSTGGDSSDEDNFSWGGDGGSGSGGGFGGSGWSGGAGWNFPREPGSGGYSEGAFHFQRALYECLWFWQLLCGATLLHALHFVVVGEQKSVSTPSPATASVTLSTNAGAHHRSSFPTSA